MIDPYGLTALGLAPGSVFPMQAPYTPKLLYTDQHHELFLMQQQMAMLNANIPDRRHGRIRNYIPRKGYRERKFMRKTKAGYRTRKCVEVAFWISIGAVLLGGVVLPVGLRVYTSLWTWALGGG